MAEAIVTEALTHDYKRHFWSPTKRALDGLSLKVAEGEIFGYLGANGAGKTTTIKILVGLHRQKSGTASIFGADTRNVESRRLVGFQPENPYFYEYLTAREAMLFYGALCKLSRNERRQRSEELLDFVGLKEAKDVRVGEFSKGMRQRLGIAQAIIHSPRLVILDEPMSGLDPVGRRQVREVILNLREQGLTVFFSSHILSDVEMIADRVGLLVKGRLHALGTIDELLAARMNNIEVQAADLPEKVSEQINGCAERTLEHQGGISFFFKSWEESDRAVKTILDGGGKVRGLRPEKETLEEYFMRENDVPREEVGAWKGGADA